ncbi:MAG: alpha/beta hydrolase [Arenicellales bacterium]|nr:alpha/beta hydrolase [Arenicellales bacterium]MDP6551469.1 alpha/beta hydrolase [Arenicellales bacterium]MDP6790461.1 alpha/beta hydrolase [Arenicellales bacterium]MDP6917700.1 alpha/beta hydrolase [Arenicellales bacterium]
MNDDGLFLETDRGYSLVARPQAGEPPWIIFLGGFRSDMEGTKAQYLSDWCAQRGRAFLRFDYSGHGQSGGRFENGTIGQWTEDALEVIQAFTEGPCILVGSSMGGWIMLRAALALGRRVRGLLGIAAAPDFTRDLISKELTPDQRRSLDQNGQVTVTSEYDPDGYILTQSFIDDGEQCCLLDEPLDIRVPVRLLQGCEDNEVPWRTALHLSEKLETTDVRVQLLKDGDHRLSSPDQLALIGDTLAELLQKLSNASS